LERSEDSYTNVRKERFQNAVLACILLRKNFQNGVLARSVTKNTPSLTGWYRTKCPKHCGYFWSTVFPPLSFNILIDAPDTSSNKAGSWWEISLNLANVASLSYYARFFNMSKNSYNMGPPALPPIWRNVCCGFLLPLKIHHFGRVWTRVPWVQWQAH
jgi:hypothetical protein